MYCMQSWCCTCWKILFILSLNVGHYTMVNSDSLIWLDKHRSKSAGFSITALVSLHFSCLQHKLPTLVIICYSETVPTLTTGCQSVFALHGNMHHSIQLWLLLELFAEISNFLCIELLYKSNITHKIMLLHRISARDYLWPRAYCRITAVLIFSKTPLLHMQYCLIISYCALFTTEVHELR